MRILVNSNSLTNLHYFFKILLFVAFGKGLSMELKIYHQIVGMIGSTVMVAKDGGAAANY
jgi:hypothetical protein